MTLNSKTELSIRNNILSGLVTISLAGGYLRIYDGVQPFNADTAIVSQTMLVELRFLNPAFSSPVNGIIVCDTITPCTDAAATGTATWFRALKNDGSTAVFDGSVGMSSSNLIIATTSINQHDVIGVPTFLITLR